MDMTKESKQHKYRLAVKPLSIKKKRKIPSLERTLVNPLATDPGSVALRKSLEEEL